MLKKMLLILLPYDFVGKLWEKKIAITAGDFSGHYKSIGENFEDQHKGYGCRVRIIVLCSYLHGNRK